MSHDESPLRPNPLGKASLILSILSICFVFSVVLCAGVGKEQGWLRAVSTLLFLFGGTFAFVGLIGAALGLGGLFGRRIPRGAAIAGLLLGVCSVLMFLAAVKAAR